MKSNRRQIFGDQHQRARRFRVPVDLKLVALAIVVALAGLAGLRFSHAATEVPVTPPPSASSPSNVSVVQDAASQIVVQYKSDADAPAITSKIAEVHGHEKRSLNKLRVKVLSVPDSEKAAALQTLKSDPRVAYAEPDAIGRGSVTTPNDPYYSNQPIAGSNIPEWGFPTSLIDLLWDKNHGSGVTVAVIDSGTVNTNPDLTGQLVGGYDFVNNDSDPSNDEVGHGTAVAGVIAAHTNNSAGIAGVCWGCKIMPLKVLDANNSTTGSLVATAINYAADHGASIINISINGTGDASVVQTAITYAASKNVAVVVSAGNGANNTQLWPAQYVPALAVAATGYDDTLDTQSSFGTHISVAAPYWGGTTFNNGGYTTLSGTSYSAPLVAGVMAVLKSSFPNATASQLRNAVVSTADTCCSAKISGGRINAARAYGQLAGTQTDTIKPTLTVTSPAQGATISGTSVPITLTVSDNVGVVKTHLRFDKFQPVVNAVSPFDYHQDTTHDSNGSHTITITAYDEAGNSATVVRSVTVSNGGTIGKQGDLNNDSKVNITDLSILLSAWNSTTNPNADLNKNGKVDISDMSILLSNWSV